MKKLIQRTLALTLFIGLSNNTLANNEAEFTFTTGVDSNPFHFSDTFKDDLAIIFDHKINYRYTADNGFFIGLDLHSISYNDVFDDANRRKSHANFGYQYQFNDQHLLQATFRQGEHDKTFISRLTGETATFNDTEIHDRFDYGWSKIELDYEFSLNSQHQLFASFDYLEKNYTDYTEINLVDLDNKNNQLSLGWHFTPTNLWQINLALHSKTRDYINRNSQDELGNFVDEQLLNINYQAVDIKIAYQMFEHHKFEIKALTETGEDQFAGYQNHDYSSYQLAWHWHFEGIGTLISEVRIEENSNDNQLNESEHEELTGYDYDGQTFKVSYLYDIWQKDNIIIDGFVNLSLSDYNANQLEYNYERQLLRIGINIRL